MTTLIGAIDEGIDGTDVYHLASYPDLDEIRNAAHRLTLAHARFLASVYDECRHPGSRFCKTSSVMQKPYSRSDFICIAHLRYDV